MRKRQRGISAWFAYLAVRTVICVIQSLNIQTCATLARYVAWFGYDVVRIRRKVIDDNLAMVYPDWSDARRQDAARRMWEHLLLMICEIAHAPRKLHAYSFKRFIHFRGQDRSLLLRYLLDPRPTILVTGHFGNFELSSFLAGLLGFPTFTIARRLDNPYLDAYVARFRQSKGQYLLDKDGCAPQVQTILERNGILGLLGDQHAGQKGITVDFLGRPASCHKAISLFTLSSGAPQVVVYLRRLATKRQTRPMQFELGVAGVADPNLGGPELDNVRTLTTWYNQRLGEAIQLAPEQYWWVHRRWKQAPPRKRRKPAQAA